MGKLRKRAQKPRQTKRRAGARAVDAVTLPATIGRPELLVGGTDKLYRRLVHGLLSFSAMHNAIRDGIAASIGLGGIQHTILQSIAHLGQTQSVSVSDISSHLNLSLPFITIETTKLQNQGLVEKRQSTTDRRKVLLKLTKQGIALFQRVAPFQRTIGDVQFSCLSASEFKQLAPLVERLVDSTREAVMLLHYLKEPNGSRDAADNRFILRMKRLKEQGEARRGQI